MRVFTFISAALPAVEALRFSFHDAEEAWSSSWREFEAALGFTFAEDTPDCQCSHCEVAKPTPNGEMGVSVFFISHVNKMF